MSEKKSCLSYANEEKLRVNENRDTKHVGVVLVHPDDPLQPVRCFKYYDDATENLRVNENRDTKYVGIVLVHPDDPLQPGRWKKSVMFNSEVEIKTFKKRFKKCYQKNPLEKQT